MNQHKVVTFGEVMMRLSPPGHAMFSQANHLDMVFGGGEANVAIALAYMGLNASHVTRFPDNLLGKAATQFLKHNWVDTSSIVFGDDMIGLYFLEKGAVHRPSQIVYVRKNSAFAKITAESIDWEKALEGASWFHWTGITPAVSIGAMESVHKAIETANNKGITVSVDVHSRKNMWDYGKAAKEVMPHLIDRCDIVFGGAHDFHELFDIELCGEKDDQFQEASIELMKMVPRIKKIFDKERESVSASHNRISGRMWNGKEFFKTEKLDVTHIVDRIGTGDAYAAGVIYGLLHYQDDFDALNFGNCTCALKHTVEGDANMVSAEMVKDLMSGDTSGKIRR
ncbi:sugar kinase [Aegicerativicinus sediminis]|uniref:sugar kinase n=1 Tax=Aegicerativicinus sediminis TaxID=2893202 RepID=UPI001E293A37|nr:sugar kinase [Aegicerativicinus sediminis]